MFLELSPYTNTNISSIKTNLMSIHYPKKKSKFFLFFFTIKIIEKFCVSLEKHQKQEKEKRNKFKLADLLLSKWLLLLLNFFSLFLLSFYFLFPFFQIFISWFCFWGLCFVVFFSLLFYQTTMFGFFGGVKKRARERERERKKTCIWCDD